MKRRYAILEAPSALGHVPEHLGVERAPGVLLEAGLADGLDARRAGCLPASGYSSVPDPRTKVMNPQPLHDYSISLAGEVEALLGNGEFPVVLGGDCSLLLGTMLALRRRGRYGVLYVDGDADFYQPEVNPLRGAASASTQFYTQDQPTGDSTPRTHPERALPPRAAPRVSRRRDPRRAQVPDVAWHGA